MPVLASLSSRRPLVLFAFLCPVMAAAQEPAGNRFQVNTYTTHQQVQQAVAMSPQGDFVVVWSTRAMGTWDIAGQRFDSLGTALGAEFEINASLGDQQYPDVAMDGGGAFVVVWSDGYPGVVRGRRYAASGVPQGAEFVVGSGSYPAVARWGSGAFVVVWRGSGGVRGRRFDAAGNTLGAEFATEIASAGFAWPDVALDETGAFVVAADVGYHPARREVQARCYAANAVPTGPAFVVNSYTTSVAGAAVAKDAMGRLMVVWNSAQDGSGLGVVGRRFDANCAALGAEAVVNIHTQDHQAIPSIAADAAGGFLITWTNTLTPQRHDVMGRRVSPSGELAGSEFVVQRGFPDTPGTSPLRPTVAGGPMGSFVVTWDEYAPAPAPFYTDIFARRLTGLGARPMNVDPVAGPSSDGNRVFEPGEAVRVEPAWFNSVEQPLAADGTASEFTGPTAPGVTYTLADPSASYGALAPGATVSCAVTGDCYTLGITFTGDRPVQHWDATFRETLEPVALGQRRPWLLHVGDSFTDVPRANPFYRFIETLLHTGVTGGCAAGRFCPLTPATREQMAVFLLKAREGPAYTPPACPFPIFDDVPVSSPFCPYIMELVSRGAATGCAPLRYCPNDPVTREQMAVVVLRTLDPTLMPPPCAPPNLFGDVPETSPFCRWIEELARRGIASGCGGGNYCPTQPVAREQMAVFLSVAFGLGLYGP